MNAESADNLAHVAELMRGNKHFSHGDARKMDAIAKRLKNGEASEQDITWAKRISSGFRTRGRRN